MRKCLDQIASTIPDEEERRAWYARSIDSDISGSGHLDHRRFFFDPALQSPSFTA